MPKPKPTPNPTTKTYTSLDDAFAFFNARLFGGRLLLAAARIRV